MIKCRNLALGAMVALCGAHTQAAPIGWLDSIILEGGRYFAVGWTCDAGISNTSFVKLYVGSETAANTLTRSPGTNTPGAVKTDQPSEPAIATACSTSGSATNTNRYRFRYELSDLDRLKFGGQELIAAGYGVNTNNSQSSTSTVLLTTHPIIPPLTGNVAMSIPYQDGDGTFSASWLSKGPLTGATFELLRLVGSSWTQVVTPTTAAQATVTLPAGTHTLKVRACKSGVSCEDSPQQVIAIGMPTIVVAPNTRSLTSYYAYNSDLASLFGTRPTASGTDVSGWTDVYRTMTRYQAYGVDITGTWDLSVSYRPFLAYIGASGKQIELEVDGLSRGVCGPLGSPSAIYNDPYSIGIQSADYQNQIIDGLAAQGVIVNSLALDGPEARLTIETSNCGANQKGLTKDQFKTAFQSFLTRMKALKPNVKIGLIANFPLWKFNASPAYGQFPSSPISDATAFTNLSMNWDYADALNRMTDAASAAGVSLAYLRVDQGAAYGAGSILVPARDQNHNPLFRLSQLRDLARQKGLKFAIVFNSDANVGYRTYSPITTIDYTQEMVDYLKCYYARMEGFPDEVVVQSWDSVPTPTLSQSTNGSFMNAAARMIDYIKSPDTRSAKTCPEIR